MPFGKFTGWAIEDLPDGYLAWLLTIELESAVLAEEIQLEAEARGLFTPPTRPGPRGRTPDPAVVDALVGAGLRTLARTHHPDVGGDPRRMRDLNVAADWLKRQARAVA